jgi:antitoxin CptB
MNDTALDGLALRRRRLLYRSWRRGMKEVDLLLGRFADAQLEAMSGDELDRFEDLLARPDPDIFGWVMGSLEVPPGVDKALIALIRNMNND